MGATVGATVGAMVGRWALRWDGGLQSGRKLAETADGSLIMTQKITLNNIYEPTNNISSLY